MLLTPDLTPAVTERGKAMTPAMPKVIRKTATRKPSKPRPDFPLYAHATKRWAKKIRGKIHYFGPWDDPAAALNRWLDQKDDLLAGRTPRIARDGLTLKHLVNVFLTAKRRQLDACELSSRMFADWFSVCELLIDSFGGNRLVDDLAPADFESLRGKLSKQYGPHRLGTTVGCVRGVFKYGLESRLIERPTHFGPQFKKPTKKTMRLHRAKGGLKMFEAAELRKITDSAGVPLRAMILLGANCGFGNSDIANLPLSAVNLTAGWVNFPRPKTGVERRCPLWKETITAIQAAIDGRPKPKHTEAEKLLFVTRHGARWGVSEIMETEVEEAGAKIKKPKLKTDDPIAKAFGKLLRRLGLHRAGVGFYALRHTFETVAGGSRDQVAVNSIMGHADSSMAGEYRERIGDARLEAVVSHVHNWLYGGKE
ncbi:MAG TPA: tyrosine-type recombinase/integrase [Pirellulales bacterium]|jgi:integrase|nr:tyrosine-type recombinase/integrase [Pirellulales bacterium]